MPDKTEKESRRQIHRELQEKTKIEFEKSLPISKELFQTLFDFLDEKLEENDCDDSFKLTKQFLETNHIMNNEEIESWLQENGGFCDCEVLYNLEEKFEK
ncbi:DUF2695 domain-containing protein [Chryseobacterium sp. C-71]|uniref:DUF2695 domain-containing protein n=1 Tax=Chryseobacterium sp. C-71 TaxID=2893882 RepID=UPI001E2B45EF|nr:DUF2695 domain-containing protein [Chryseobacterium sp. C-71]UFH33460.1 DUF2695 domain-containing protein [Chryseobacterium sp. C-71]